MNVGPGGQPYQNTGPAAGRFPDNERPGGFRWWDGQAWTEHRSPPPGAAPQPGFGAEQQFGATVQVPQQQQPFPQQQQFGAPQQQQFGAPQQQVGGPQAQFGAAQPWAYATPAATASSATSPAVVVTWLGILALLIGPFLDWVTVAGGGDSVSTKGVSSEEGLWIISSIPDGYVAIVLGVLAAIGAFIFRSSKSRGAAGLITFGGSGAASWIVGSFLHIKSKVDSLAGAFSDQIDLTPGVGMIIAGIGAILAVIGGVMLKVQAGASPAASRGPNTF